MRHQDPAAERRRVFDAQDQVEPQWLRAPCREVACCDRLDDPVGARDERVRGGGQQQDRGDERRGPQPYARLQPWPANVLLPA